VTAAILLVGAGVCLGMALLTLASAVEAGLGWRPRAILALPAPVRRFLAGAAATAVIAGIAGPATADEAYPGWAPAVPAAVPVEQPSTPVELHAESTAPAPHVHVVQRGESLWRITAKLLGPDASDSAIAAAWPTIYEANRGVIGSNPGLILPGQTLVIPQEVAA